jgi:glucosamine 6-phosphate synthetase-like amidotransferase/phosphosugar isomerase protein
MQEVAPCGVDYPGDRRPRRRGRPRPLVYDVPVQLMAYHAAVMLGTDIDQPRNLAKSVTAE